MKLTPEDLTSEEISKLWTAFQAKYRPTSAYRATVVLIESDQPVKTALPVRSRYGYAVSFQRPVIEQVRPYQANPDPDGLEPAFLAGNDLVIVGERPAGGPHASPRRGAGSRASDA